MILDGEPSTGTLSPERLSLTLTFEPVHGLKVPKVPLLTTLTIFSLTVTLTFDVTSKSNQLIFVPKCSSQLHLFVKLMKFSQAVCHGHKPSPVLILPMLIEGWPG